MKPLLEVLSAVLGGQALQDGPILMAADAKASHTAKQSGLLYGDLIRDAIDDLADPGPHSCDTIRAAYYLGLQMGWRAAQRFR